MNKDASCLIFLYAAGFLLCIQHTCFALEKAVNDIFANLFIESDTSFIVKFAICYLVFTLQSVYEPAVQITHSQIEMVYCGQRCTVDNKNK